ncbi:VPS53 [[Candida] subhashii]|uniref:VPS53 n=1 Tax=[Candida] subhashii TaxID=561895 RepID=A0A8J5QKS5_9ASCO|nr:VPS53 [[Candida] subhashii]KAG7662606.1 VPS53 [[Candida] subhashii]
MDTYNFDPNVYLNEIFNSPDSLKELPQLLDHTHKYKRQLQQEIKIEINEYDYRNTSSTLSTEIGSLIEDIRQVKANSATTQESITLMTSSIQKLDCYKKNLVLSMTIIKRLQMLVNAHNTLRKIISTHNYKEILQLLSVMKELLSFFKPYRAIDEINKINLMIVNTQNKLTDDIFIDFEDYMEHRYNREEEQLTYGCEILELIDTKYKDKLLNWFYNLQLKDIKAIFNNLDEAGSLDNLDRRYIYFNKILKDIQARYAKAFPQDWRIEVEITKMFCRLTKKDISNLLSRTKPNSKTVLDNLTTTLEFEKNLNQLFQTGDFHQIISSVFEPHLSIWVQEQEKHLNSKLLEFSATSQLPPEFKDEQDISTILRVNNVPNIAVSSTELFKTYHKILTQILKLTNGETLLDLAKLFSKYLFEYHNRILLPILPKNDNDLGSGIESLKYLTMILNTGDYIVNNIDDLAGKFSNIVQEEYKERIPAFDASKEIYFQLINRCISTLVVKLTNDYKYCWREFVNFNWQELDVINDVSSYMAELKKVTIKNIKVALPLIIRDSYIRNFNDRLVELLVTTIANNLKMVKTLNVLSYEQILLDVSSLKELALQFPLYSDPNYDDSKAAETQSSKSYQKFVTNHFHDLESLLKLLMVPTIPVENIIESYFELIGDKSIQNFIKVLNLKKINRNEQSIYVENFKLQLTIEDGSLITSCQLLSNLEDNEDTLSSSTHSSRVSTPVPTDMKSPKLLPVKMNNFEKNLREFAMTGETHVNKFNENIKNFGKFFRKETNE